MTIPPGGTIPRERGESNGPRDPAETDSGNLGEPGPRAHMRPYPLPGAARLGRAPAVFQFTFHFIPVDGSIPARHVPYGHVFRARFMAWLDEIGRDSP